MQAVFYCPICGSDYGPRHPGYWHCQEIGCPGNLRKGQPPRGSKKADVRQPTRNPRKPTKKRGAASPTSAPRSRSTRTERTEVFFRPDCGTNYGQKHPGFWHCQESGCSGNLRRGKPPRGPTKPPAQKPAPKPSKPAKKRGAGGRKPAARSRTKRAEKTEVFFCPECGAEYGSKHPGFWHCQESGCSGNLRKGTPPDGGRKRAPTRAPARRGASARKAGKKTSKKRAAKPARVLPDLSSLKGADLIEAGDLQGHVEFIRELATAHSWSKPTQKRIRDELKRLEHRRNDPNLYMGVVGEFSSGKSTFINALLRDDLLKTDVLQATTAAVTLLRHGPGLDVEVTRKDGSHRRLARSRSFWPWLKDVYNGSKIRKRDARIRDFIHKATAVESIAETLEEVTVFHPSSLVAKQVVIVDTPGANAENQRHVEVAQWALAERCDAAIILVPADQPLSSSLVEFIQESLADVLHRCVFVVTKLDTIRRVKDREVLLRNIRKRIEQALGAKKPRVVGIAARVIVDQIAGEADGLTAANRERFVKQFGEFEELMYAELERQRELIQAERLLSLASKLMTWLPAELSKQQEVHRGQHSALEKNRIPDLDSFIEESQDQYIRQYRLEVASYRGQLLRGCGEMKKATLARIRKKLDRVDETAEFDGFVKRHVDTALTDALIGVDTEYAEAIDGIGERAQVQLDEFETVFEEKYQTLSRLAQDLELYYGAESIELDVGSGLDARALRVVNAQIDDGDAVMGWSAGGGAAVGAAIGTVALPGVGSLLGGLAGAGIGAFAGAFFGPSIEKLRVDYWNTLAPKVGAYLDQLTSRAVEEFEKSFQGTEEELELAMSAYSDQYGDLVKKMFAADEAEARRLEEMREQIDLDSDELVFRKAALDQWREALKKAK